MLAFYLVVVFLGFTSSKPALRFKFIVNKNSVLVRSLGGMALINCETDDANAKVTLWKIDGGKRNEVLPGHPNVFVDDGEYIIKKLLSKDAGKYECVAVSGNKRITRQTRLKIDHSKPALEMSPTTEFLPVFTGRSINLFCEGVGSSSITWEFHHLKTQLKPSDYSTNKYTVNKHITRSVLTVPYAKKGFSGFYRCKLHYARGRTIVDQIHILVKDPQAPSIKNSNRENITVKLGQPQTLHCVADGFPKPVVSWEKDGKLLRPCQKIFTHSCSSAPYLTISNGIKITSVQFPRDNGRFTCIANNMVGTTRKTFDVLVEVKPELEFSKQLKVPFHFNPYDINCKAIQGNPPPKFTWRMRLTWRDMKLPWTSISSKSAAIKVSKDKMTSTITVPGGVSSAIFECTATNAVGSDTYEVEFKRHVPYNYYT